MKPFLGIDLTENRKNDQPNGTELIAATPSPAMQQALETSMGKADDAEARAKLPLPILIVQYACGILGVIIFGSLLRGISEVSFAQAYKNAGWLFWLCGGCLALWALLKFWSTRKETKVLGSEESTHVLSNLENISNSIYTELGVPTDASEVDILSFFYKNKDGQIKICEKGIQLAKFMNPAFKIYKDADNLYLTNLTGKHAFPLSSLKAIRKINKNGNVITWNKVAATTEGRFKQYKLTVDNYGRIHFKNYYILELTHNGEEWGIYIPCYELPALEYYTGLKAE